MDARLTNEMLAQRAAASHAVAGALAPRNTTSTAKSTSATGTSTGATGSPDITSNDFLTLLVSELKNQDPTQPTDPNEYITQLAQVNSLEQLIQINSGISTLDSSVPTTTAGSSTPAASVSGSSHAASLQPASAGALSRDAHTQVPGAGTA